MTEKKVTVDDIIGLVKTGEPTDSVEEVRKLRGRETGYVLDWNNQRFNLTDKKDISKLAQLLNMLHEENQQLLSEMFELGTTHAEEINKIEDKFDEEILKLEKENEQLKQQLKTKCSEKKEITYEPVEEAIYEWK